MAKSAKKESINDLKNEFAEKAIDVVETVEVKAGEALESVSQNVEDVGQKVKKKRFVSSVFRKLTVGRLLVVLLLLLAVGGISGAGYFYWQYTKTQEVLGSSQNQFSEVKEIVDEVSKLMELPNDEPTVATVSDVEKLRNQPFFTNAQNGDKVIIYQSTRKAILYRPSITKIIDVATVNLGEEPKTAIASPTPDVPQGPASVTLWNGTTTTGLTVKAESDLKDVDGIEISERDNAQKRNYDKTIVIKVGNVPDATLEAVADVFGAEIVSLPSDEQEPESDILVILGGNYVSSSSEQE